VVPCERSPIVRPFLATSFEDGSGSVRASAFGKLPKLLSAAPY
jgi:hypothetical protein